MEEFREAINCCSFKDLGFCGPEYTWCNMQEGVHRRCLRLDRALATQDWINHYKDIRVHHLVASTSDHVALLISDSFALNKPQRRFQFEAMWTRRDECRDIIKEAWTGSVRADNPCDIVASLKRCVDDLSKWNKAVFGNVPRQIQKKRNVLNDLVLKDQNGRNGREINKIRKEINELLDCKEVMWQQRSKVQWMGLGDCNTKYFHSKASGRKKKNTISRLLDDSGVWRESTLGVVEVAVSYFEKLYTTSHPNRILEVIDTMEPKVSVEMNQNLIEQFTKEQVEAALKHMHPTKSPGPDDGFSSLINKAIRSQAMNGLSICRGSPMISHLFFTNDSLLFCKVSSQECQHLIDILRLYEAASGKKINTDKSSVFFSANTPKELKIETLDILGPMQDSRHSKYLGLPSVIGKSKMDIFAEIKDRVARKLSRWKEKNSFHWW
ncbi:uncharacterized protein LOC112024084 [Quercus suber]|uniref:uncharacterized protein LOC112024084 n=1 Tax=Quercus suber TaxID=58331 RepID=UPI000CE27ADF|nr:uncharacterized protein LOC112024084 [Quercus suber]